MAENKTVELSCDWTDEHGEVCGETATIAGEDTEGAAHEAGWGWYANAYIRRDRWTTGAHLWFCPIHASVFRANHGWGGLEDYGPPKHWWKPVWRAKGGK